MLPMQSFERLNLGSDDQDMAIVLASAPELRDLGKRTLQNVLPKYLKIVEAGSPNEVLSLISEKVALIMAFDDDDKLAVGLAASLFSRDDAVPFFLVMNPAAHDAYADKFKDLGFVDDIIETPLRDSEVVKIFQRAIARRRGLSLELENDAKIAVLKEFTDYYLNLARAWKENASRISFAPKSEDICDFLSNIDEVIKILGRLSAENPMEISVAALRTYIHDLNNKLTILISYPGFIKETPGLTPEDDKILTMIEDEAYQLSFYSKQISMAYNGKAFWQDVKKTKLGLRTDEKLEIPAGTVFCLIDDDNDILRITRKMIETAGGVAVLVAGKDALEKFFESENAGKGLPKVDVFLLDNNLGGGVFGHQLIPLIRSKYPDALIVAHTSDDLSLNNDPKNEYKRAGVEVVGKRHWAAISDAVKRIGSF